MLKYMSESIVKDISVIIQTRTETYQSDNMGCYHTKKMSDEQKCNQGLFHCIFFCFDKEHQQYSDPVIKSYKLL